MQQAGLLIGKLHSIRNRYEKEASAGKLRLLTQVARTNITRKKDAQLLYELLLFLLAYPDNPTIYQSCLQCLNRLEKTIQSSGRLQNSLFNSGITKTSLCAAFSFEIVKWLRQHHRNDIKLSSFEASDGQIQAIVSVVLPKVESEILQDANSDWRSWLKGSLKKGEDLLDGLIGIFSHTDVRPEVKDELWNALGVNVEIRIGSHQVLPSGMFNRYYHRSLIRKNFATPAKRKMTKVALSNSEAESIIESGRLILIRHLREIDPISFAAPSFVSYYQLPRGLSIALTGMATERRHPIDSYMGYLVFKNGLPVAYAASWVLFDSARIGLNVFPAYRGGESQYIFDQVLKLHAKVYRLKRFSVDPYQLGKENSDGIVSGAFWVYYHAGFRPIAALQKKIAEVEASKIGHSAGYRTPRNELEKLAKSRMEIILHKSAVQFDATDLSRAYVRILKEQHHDNRQLAEEILVPLVAKLLQIKSPGDERMKFILKNWCVLLGSIERDLRKNNELKNSLKKLFELKSFGDEEAYIFQLQKAAALRKLLGHIVAPELRQR